TARTARARRSRTRSSRFSGARARSSTPRWCARSSTSESRGSSRSATTWWRGRKSSPRRTLRCCRSRKRSRKATVGVIPPAAMAPTDVFSRPLRNLRISVTDRCNLRCAYCMPEEDYVWLPNAEILSFEEVSALVDRFIALGVRKVRLTGGEPLLRRDLPELVKLLAAKPLDDLALTTNGVLLEQQASALREAGLHRVTVSLDTLKPARFVALTRRDAHAKVLAGIAAAHAAGFPAGLKLDCVALKGLNDDELKPLLDFGAEHGAEVRFIEYMDVGGATLWSRPQ